MGQILLQPALKIEKDIELMQKMKALHDEALKAAEILDSHNVNQSLLRSLSNSGTGGLLLKTVVDGQTSLDVDTVVAYLKNVEADSQLPLPENLTASPDVCEHLKKVVGSMSSQPNEDLKALAQEISCVVVEGGDLREVSKSFMDHLSTSKLTWRFNYYHLRVSIMTLFQSMRDVKSENLKLLQRLQMAEDVEAVRSAVLKIPNFPPEEEVRAKSGADMGWLYHSYVDEVENRIKEIEGRLKGEGQ